MPKTRRASRKQRGGFLDFLGDLFGSSTPSANANVRKNEGTNTLAPPAVPTGGRRKNRKSRKQHKSRKNTRRSCRH